MNQCVAAFAQTPRIFGLIFLTALMTQSANADFRSTFGQLLNPPSPNPPQAVTRVYAKESGALASGSGSLIHVDEQFGYVLTNWHVVRDAENGQVMTRFPNGFESAATILKMDEKWDLALLRIWKPNVSPLPLSSTVPVLGERLTIMGYGSGKFRAAHGACKYYASPDNQSPSEMIEISAEARQGDSGGPMMNERGELAAVLFGSGRGVTTGTHIGRVVEFLNSIDYRVDETHRNESTDKSAIDNVAERVVDEKRSRQASLVTQQQIASRKSEQYYQLPPLEWSTIDDNSEVVAAAAQVATGGTLVAQNPQPRVANQALSKPRLSLTIEPFEPDGAPNSVPELEIDLPEPAAMQWAAQPMTQPQLANPGRQRTSLSPSTPSHETLASAFASSNLPQNANNSAALRTGISNHLDPLAAQSSLPPTSHAVVQSPPPGYSQPQFSAYGPSTYNAAYPRALASSSTYPHNNIEMPRLNLRKLFAIAQSILAIVGVVTLLEKFRR